MYSKKLWSGGTAAKSKSFCLCCWKTYWSRFFVMYIYLYKIWFQTYKKLWVSGMLHQFLFQWTCLYRYGDIILFSFLIIVKMCALFKIVIKYHNVCVISFQDLTLHYSNIFIFINSRLTCIWKNTHGVVTISVLLVKMIIIWLHTFLPLYMAEIYGRCDVNHQRQ